MDNKTKLEVLASFIVLNLKCQCGCAHGDQYKEPCACGWTNVEEMFTDEFNMELKVYNDSLDKYYTEYFKFNKKE